jgi:hypothetical protein
LRRAIDLAEPLDPGVASPTEARSAFVKVFEKDGAYWKAGRNGEDALSNFILEPNRRIKVDRQEVLEAAVCMNGHGASAVTLWPHHWASKAAFKRALGDLGSGWVGTEDDIQQVKVLTAGKDCPKYRGADKLGLHRRDGEWVLVPATGR